MTAQSHEAPTDGGYFVPRQELFDSLERETIEREIGVQAAGKVVRVDFVNRQRVERSAVTPVAVAAEVSPRDREFASYERSRNL